MRTFLAVLLVATACARPAPPAAPAQEVDGTTAHRVARAGVLRAAELPGFTPDRDDGPGGGRGRVGSCLAQGTPPITDESTAFERGHVYLVSSAAVAPTLAAVRADEAFMRKEFAACFERFVTFWFAQADVTVRKYRSTPFDVRVQGADMAVGYRIALTAETNGRSVRAGAAVVAATTGHAELLILTMAVRDAVPSRAMLTGLLAKMVTRAAAAER